MRLATIKLNNAEVAGIVTPKGILPIAALNEAKGTAWKTEMMELIQAQQIPQLTAWYNAGGKEELEAMEEPVVLVLFGDHKPWAGNAESAYAAAGVSFDISTAEGFYNYYSTPYLIWANPAAKTVLGSDFAGRGEDVSPCFLMAELFDLCGWEGSGFMQLQRQIRDITPLLHVQNLYWQDGLTDKLSTEDQKIVDLYRWTEYYRETEGK